MVLAKLFGNKIGRRVRVEDMPYTIRELPPIRPDSYSEYIAIPEFDIRSLAEKYFAAMESGETEKWCRCPWLIHPDDRGLKQGQCRECTLPNKHEIHNGLPEDFEDGATNRHNFVGRRMRRMDDSPECPVHTKEGMLTYFFTWIFDQHD